MQIQDNTPICYREETEVLSVKPLRRPPSSYSNKASRNRVLSSCLDRATRPIAFAKALLLPSSTKTSLDTLKGCGKCLDYQPLTCMEMERYKLKKIHNEVCREL